VVAADALSIVSSTAAVNSALGGLTGAQEWFYSAAVAVAHASLPNSKDDLVDAVVQSKLASQAVKVNAASLHAALQNERTLIDIFA
jgi:hypothetical protein